MSLSQVQLDRVKFCLSRVASHYLLDAEVDIELDRITHDIEFRLRGYLIEKNLCHSSTYEFKYPATWWDAFVLAHARLFPRWYLRKWPIQYTKVIHTVDCSVAFPDFDMPSGRPFTNKLYIAQDNTRYQNTFANWLKDSAPASTATLDLSKRYQARPTVQESCPHKYDLRLFRPSNIQSNFNWGSTQNWICQQCGASYRDAIR